MADCNSCKESRATVSMAVFDRVMLNHNATVKRLWATIILLIVLLVGSNAAWLWYENQFTDIEVTQENEDGYNNFIGNDGDITNGETND